MADTQPKSKNIAKSLFRSFISIAFMLFFKFNISIPA